MRAEECLHAVRLAVRRPLHQTKELALTSHRLGMDEQASTEEEAEVLDGVDPTNWSPTSQSPRVKHESFDSTAYSEDKETDSSVAFQSPSIRAHMSASQILDRSDMFHAPTLDHLETVASRSENDEQKDSQDTTHSSSVREQDPLAKSGILDPKGKATIPQSGVSARSAGNLLPELQIPRNLSSPSLQDIVKSGAYPLQRAGAFASYLRNRSNRLATESMTYIEKVSGMLSGPSKALWGE